jgi:hypothetical protein
LRFVGDLPRKPFRTVEGIMGRKAILILMAACFLTGSACGEGKFKTAPGMAMAGGAVSINQMQGFGTTAFSILSININPIFGQFLTKDTLLYTFCAFQFNVNFNDQTWNGGIDLGAQGRYFFTTDAAVNFFLGLQISFGLKLVPDYRSLQEHAMTGVVFGMFVPMNEKVGLDFSFNPIFYIPLNTYQPFAMLVSLSAGVISTL